MPVSVSYHPGGFNPSTPAGNRAEEFDSDSGTCTRWNTDGEVTESRSLTADELAALAPAPAVEAPDIVTLANNLAALTEAVDFLILDSLGGF